MINQGLLGLDTLADCRRFAIREFGANSFAVEFVDAHIAIYGADRRVPFNLRYIGELLERKHKEGVNCGKEAAREMLRERRDFPFLLIAEVPPFVPMPQYDGAGIAGIAHHAAGGNFQSINTGGEGRQWRVNRRPLIEMNAINPTELKIRLDKNTRFIVAEAECGGIYTIDYLGWLVLKEKIEAAITQEKTQNA